MMKAENQLRRGWLAILAIALQASMLFGQEQSEGDIALALANRGADILTKKKLLELQTLQIGANAICLKSVRPQKLQSENGDRQRYGLTRADFSRIVRTIPTIRRVTPSRTMFTKARSGQHEIECQLTGSVPDFYQVQKIKVRRGRFLTRADDSKNVTVLSRRLAASLFKVSDPIGKHVQLAGELYVVVGVIDNVERRASAVALSVGIPFSEVTALIPLQTMRQRIGDLTHVRPQSPKKLELVELTSMHLTTEIEDVVKSSEIVGRLLEKNHPEKDVEVFVPLVGLRENKERPGPVVLVDLRGVDVSNKDLEHVLGLKRLQVLLLNNTSVGDEELAKLHALKSLKRIWLQGTKVSDKGIQKFRQALPDCRVDG